MICQNANQLSNSALIDWMSAEKADNEVLVVFCVEDHKLVFSIGDAQSCQLHKVERDYES